MHSSLKLSLSLSDWRNKTKREKHILGIKYQNQVYWPSCACQTRNLTPASLRQYLDLDYAGNEEKGGAAIQYRPHSDVEMYELNVLPFSNT